MPGYWSVQATAQDVRNRTATFREYQRRTGVWPSFSIVLYAGRFVVMLLTIVLTCLYGWRQGASAGEVAWTLVLFLLPTLLLWVGLEVRAWNYELRRKRLSSRGISFGLTQLPRE